MINRPDSLLFDMDGTLWNATNTYVEAWNSGFAKMGLKKKISYDDLASIMGWSRRKALEKLLPEYEIEMQEKIYDVINEGRGEIVRRLGGELYDGVIDGLRILSEKYKLFIVSNCPVGMIRNFIDWAKIDPYITDEIAHGVNLKPKHHNIQLLIDKYQLKNPVYIGDTGIDSEESRLAGIPFVFLTYGFGTTDQYDLKFDDFNDLTNYFNKL